jgi:hypothetical protein
MSTYSSGYDNSLWHLHSRHSILLHYAKSFLAPGTGERIEVRGFCLLLSCSPLILTFSPQGEKELLIQQLRLDLRCFSKKCRVSN